MKRLMGAGLGIAAAVALAMGPVTPAAADEATPSDAAAALAEWKAPASRAVTAGKPAPATEEAPAGLRVAKVVGGKRLTDRRGSFLMWTQNTLEWFWTSTRITSSKGWQSRGFVFPNIARNAGIKRSAKFATKHLWRGSNTVGAGVVSPWGDVTVYSTTITDYYTLKRGGGYQLK